MKFVSDIRLLILGVWFGSAVFFIGVAENAFAVIEQRDIAGAMVGRCLSLLNYAGVGIAGFLILTSFVGMKNVNRVWLWIERFLLLILGAACAVSQFVIGIWIASVRSQMGKPLEELAADDPLRLRFDMLHEYSVWVLIAAMAAALLAFFIIANRKFSGPAAKADVYDFSKEFKI